MPTYKLTSQLFEGHLQFEYENNRLSKYADYSDMGDMQRTWLSANMPMFEEDIKELNTNTSKVIKTDKQTLYESFSNSILNEKSPD